MSEKETIELGLLANNRGGMEYKKQFCGCDPDVGVFVCEYCAIDAGLRAGLRAIEREKKLMEILEMVVAENNCSGKDSENWTCLALIRAGKPATLCGKCQAEQALAATADPWLHKTIEQAKEDLAKAPEWIAATGKETK